MTWTLHLGDCLDPVSGLVSLPDMSVDHAITDPPYEAQAHIEGRRQKVGRAGVGGYRGVMDSTLPFLPITDDARAGVAMELGRLVRGWASVFCQAEAISDWKAALERAGFRHRRVIPFLKPDAMPSLHGRWPGQAWEAIVLAGKPSAPRCPVGGKAVRYEFSRARAGQPGGPGGDRAPHPTTKPLPLMVQMVEDFTREGDLVLDPFAGSGTTGVACRMLGRRFIGWEMNPEYHAIAMRRIAGEEAKPRAEQPSLFGGG